MFEWLDVKRSFRQQGSTYDCSNNESIVDTESPNHSKSDIHTQADEGEGDEVEDAHDPDDPARIAGLDVLRGERIHAVDLHPRDRRMEKDRNRC